ncbi:tyrosine-type recombinase/integrase [Lysinibacillus sp. 54212]|uniref:tyrosine-type recombinase/integrase n=1 Tax=Lysinibacillus sp. 54212 TaxID=3119829 RepID=UPI002FC8A91F
MKKYIPAYKAYLVSARKSEHTIKQYENDAKQFANFFHEQPKEDINEVIQNYVNDLHEKYNSKSSINRKLAALKAFLGFLLSRQYIESFQETLLHPIQQMPEKLNTLSEQQLIEVLACWEKYYRIAEKDEHKWLAMRNLAITHAIATLGIKPAELVKMKWTHIDEDTHQIVILQRNSYRTLQLPTDTMQILLQYKEETHKFFPQLDNVEELWLGVGNKLGSPITVKTVERIFQQLSKMIGFKISCTNLRYTVINRLMQEAELEDIYIQLGYARKGVLAERQHRLHQEEL